MRNIQLNWNSKETELVHAFFGEEFALDAIASKKGASWGDCERDDVEGFADWCERVVLRSLKKNKELIPNAGEAFMSSVDWVQLAQIALEAWLSKKGVRKHPHFSPLFPC